MRARLLLGPLVAGLVVAACGNGGGDCTCATGTTWISSPGKNMLRASGCGNTVVCLNAPCDRISFPAPPDGGSCTVTVTFADGSETTFDADWGAVTGSGCCGPIYEHDPSTTVYDDAGPISDAAPDAVSDAPPDAASD